MKGDAVVDELFVFVDEFAGEEGAVLHPFEEDAVAFPEVEVEEVGVGNPLEAAFG